MKVHKHNGPIRWGSLTMCGMACQVLQCEVYDWNVVTCKRCLRRKPKPSVKRGR